MPPAFGPEDASASPIYSKSRTHNRFAGLGPGGANCCCSCSCCDICSFCNCLPPRVPEPFWANKKWNIFWYLFRFVLYLFSLCFPCYAVPLGVNPRSARTSSGCTKPVLACPVDDLLLLSVLSCSPPTHAAAGFLGEVAQLLRRDTVSRLSLKAYAVCC